MPRTSLIYLFIIYFCNYGDCARILGIFPIPSVSHQVVYRQLMLALNEKGHEIVIITPNPISNPPRKYKQIDVREISYKMFKEAFDFATMVGSKRPHSTILMKEIMSFTCSMTEQQLNNSDVKALIESDQKFDLLFLEWLVSPVYLAFAHHYQVPFIGISSLSLMVTGFDTVGNPSHPAYLPDSITGSFKDLTFWERLDSTYYGIYFRYRYYYVHMKCQDEQSKRYFGSEVPYIGDIERNVSLLMSNTHYSTGIVRPLVPAIIELGGPPLHLTKAKSKMLPKDLQDFLDSATDGVIYFSLGSNVKSSTMPESKRALFLNAFRQINQKVLWKWETDDLPGKPDNVKVQKWLPQTDVLAHPNVKGFITQGGLQSMGEATHFEVPLVVIPFFADQELNAKKLESVGVAVRLDFETMTEQDILSAVKEIVTNPKYKESMGKYAALTRDQPQTPMERAVWWTEYVLRHKGARHLRSSAVDMPWYQYFMLDVLGFLLLVTTITLYSIYFITKKTIQLVFGKSKPKKD